MAKSQSRSGFAAWVSKNRIALLWAALGVLLVGMLFARTVFEEYLWLTIALGVLLVADVAILIRENQKALRTRAASYGLNSAITVILVIGIIGVVNFIASRYPLKADLTRNKIHTLSDQTLKVVKGLTKTVKAEMFVKLAAKDQYSPLMDNYKALNPKFEVEYVDPDKVPTRAKQVGIKKYGTLHLQIGAKETKIEEPNEEKLTNALIKLLKEKSAVLCTITGHGERNFSGNTAEDYEVAKKGLADQSYELKEVNLMTEGKLPDTCGAIAIVGPTKAFFEPEVKILKDYLANGGRALVALDLNIKGTEFSPQVNAMLESWYVRPVAALTVDPFSKLFGVDASVPILTGYSKENAITKEMQGQTPFPFMRPIEVIPGAPTGLTVQWLAQTNPKAFAVTNFKELQSGKVQFVPGRDKQGPLNAAVAVDGKLKDSKAPRNTRLVVFGSAQFANNNFGRYGTNLDFFLNSVSWIMEDESLISIRGKEEGAGRVELSQKAGTTIFILTVLLIPLAVAVAGIVIWVLRRRM